MTNIKLPEKELARLGVEVGRHRNEVLNDHALVVSCLAHQDFTVSNGPLTKPKLAGLRLKAHGTSEPVEVLRKVVS